jgi:hypothetical protein
LGNVGKWGNVGKGKGVSEAGNVGEEGSVGSRISPVGVIVGWIKGAPVAEGVSVRDGVAVRTLDEVEVIVAGVIGDTVFVEVMVSDGSSVGVRNRSPMPFSMPR